MKIETFKIKISEAESIKTPAHTTKDAVYDKEKGELTFKAKRANGQAFRLVHDNKKVMALIAGTDKTVTSTIHEMEELATEKEALDRIKALGLEYNPPDKNDISPGKGSGLPGAY